MGLKVLVLVCMATHALALGASPRLGPPWARGGKAMAPPHCSDTEVEEPFSRTIHPGFCFLGLKTVNIRKSELRPGFYFVKPEDTTSVPGTGTQPDYLSDGADTKIQGPLWEFFLSKDRKLRNGCTASGGGVGAPWAWRKKRKSARSWNQLEHQKLTE